MKKILVISYYYHHPFDAGGARWRRFVQHMKMDYDVSVFAPDLPIMQKNYPYIIKFLINHTLYPDYRKRFVWRAKRHIRRNKYDLVITSYPPISTLQLGHYVKRKGMRWLLDIRDPFIMYHNRDAGNTGVSNFIRMLHVIRYIRKADKITFINNRLLLSIYNTFRHWLKLDDVSVLTQTHE
jgi:hypothetical protein